MQIGLGLGLGMLANMGFPSVNVINASVTSGASSVTVSLRGSGGVAIDSHAEGLTPGVISSLTDRSGNGHDWVSPGGVEPTVEATSGPNSNQSIRFADTKYMQLPSDPFGALAELDLFAIVKVDSGSVSNALWGLGSDAGGYGDQYYPYAVDSKIYEDAGSTTRRDALAHTQDLTAWHLHRVTSTSSEYTITTGTQEIFTSGTNTVDPSPAPGLGCNNISAPTRFMKGNLARLLIFDHKLSAAELTSFKAGLAVEYGALPGL